MARNWDYVWVGRVALVGCAFGLVFGLGASVAVASPGQLDSSFGTGGVFTSSFQTPQSPGQLAFATVDSQRRTVIASTRRTTVIWMCCG
jgi:hypothetical protein